MRAARFLLGMVLAVLVLAAGAYAFRLPIASHALRSAMSGAGLENPQGRVAALSLNGVRLEGFAAGPEGREAFRFETVEADYDWRRLLSARVVEAVRVGEGAARIEIGPDGTVSLAGLSLPQGGDSGGEVGASGLPFSTLSLEEIAFVVDAPEGRATGTLSAEYDVGAGGRALLSAASEAAAWRSFRVENARLDLDVAFDPDGAARLTGAVRGGLAAPEAAIRNVDFDLSGEGGSWRSLAAGEREGFAFRATLSLNNADIPVEASPLLSSLAASPAARTVLGASASSAAASGEIVAEAGPDGFVVRLGAPDRRPSLRLDSGPALSVGAIDGGAIFTRGEDSERAAFSYRLEGAALNGSGVLIAETHGDGWRIAAPLSLEAFASDPVSFRGAEIDLAADITSEGVDADISADADIREASFGPLTIFDAPVRVSAKAAVDPAARVMTATLAEGCLTVDAVRAVLDGQDMEASLNGAALCPGGGPFAVFQWSGDPQVDIAGEASASSARYRQGEIAAAGAPPRVVFSAVQHPRTGEFSANGTFRGGRIALNDALAMSAMEGGFDLALDADGMRAAAQVASVRVAQHDVQAPLVAPVIAAGEVELADAEARFFYEVRTPDGERLGGGLGAHDLGTGRGSASFAMDSLVFAPKGLQPAKLAPVLRGFIREAAGAASGAAEYAWSPDGAASSARVVLDNITFEGPTRAVTKTTGVNGDLQFTNLWPVATGGAQTVTVDAVNLDALQLENGEIVFNLPGDDTVRLVRATFPWFGGMIGAYDATASFTGGEAVVPLRVDGMDLKLALEHVNINGLSGEGALSGVLPLTVEQGRARIENGVLQSDGAGVLRYESDATDEAAAAGEQVRIAFDLLRDLRYETMGVSVNGPLDGRLDFQMRFEGTGVVNMDRQNARVPVAYNINLDAALLELLNQANLSTNVELQVQRALNEAEAAK